MDDRQDTPEEIKEKENLIKEDGLELNKPVTIRYFYDEWQENRVTYSKVSKEETENLKPLTNDYYFIKNCMRCGNKPTVTKIQEYDKSDCFEGYCKSCCYKMNYYKYSGS